jgi:hypothetical protein
MVKDVVLLEGTNWDVTYPLSTSLTITLCRKSIECTTRDNPEGQGSKRMVDLSRGILSIEFKVLISPCAPPCIANMGLGDQEHQVSRTGS